MLFNSWEFLILLVATTALYYLPLRGDMRRVWQIGLLLAASATFYAWENPKLLMLLGCSCLLNALAAERILFWKKRIMLNDECSILNEADLADTNESPKDAIQHPTSNIQHPRAMARQWLVAAVAVNLGLLAFFKYAAFLASLAPSGWIGKPALDWCGSIPLPVGISFYTFQGISLLVDTWRRDISAHSLEMLSRRGSERAASVRDLSFYISFFPQLVAGPIVKARDFLDQIGAKQWQQIDWLTVRRGLIVGYFLKIFVADNLAEQTAPLTIGAGTVASMSSINALSMLYGYSLQIFADFAGYSLIAIGLGALFGYKLPPNFNFPYLSTSITEFWRRWHLSLSSWLRDYLYIPLGGNRKGSGRTYFNLFLVMFLGGLWHGAAWKFALWGSLHGIFLAAERLAKSQFWMLNVRFWMKKPKSESAAGKDTFNIQNSKFKIPFTVSKWLLTFHLVTALWLTFMMPDMASIAAFFQAIASFNLGFSGPPVFALAFYGSAVVLYHGWGWFQEHHNRWSSKLCSSPLEPMCHGFMLFLTITNPGAPRGFIYFQF